MRPPLSDIASPRDSAVPGYAMDLDRHPRFSDIHSERFPDWATSSKTTRHGNARPRSQEVFGTRIS